MAQPGIDGILGIDTATADVAVAVAIGGRVVCERGDGPEPGGRPRHASRLLADVERGGHERRAAGSGSGRSRSGSAPARSPACGSGSRPRGRWPRAAACRWSGSARLPRWRAGSASSAPGRARLAVIDARRERGLRGALRELGARRSGARSSTSPEALAERLAEPARAPRGGRGRLATISAAARVRGRGGASRRGPGSPDGGAARLRAGRGGRAGAARGGQTGLSEKTRRGGMA